MPSMRRGLFVLCAAVAALAPGLAQAWWNDDWQFRKELTFDLSAAGANISGTPTNVPVLVRLSLANFEFFNDTKPDGGDLRFIAGDDKTALKYHVERYDPQSQMAFIWVQMPRLAGGAAGDKIYLYYGNKDAAAASDPGGTYDTNQALVYHFGPASSAPQDSTAYKTEPSAFQAGVTPAALIGSGAQFSGSTLITVPAQRRACSTTPRRATRFPRGCASPRRRRAPMWRRSRTPTARSCSASTARAYSPRPPGGGQTVTVAQAGDGISVGRVASRRAHDRRRQAHAVDRRRGSGQPADDGAGDRR